MPHEDADDQDRVVARRVRNPTDAEPGDEAAYRAANPLPDDSQPTSEQSTTSGSTTAAAAAELTEANESEPDRTE